MTAASIEWTDERVGSLTRLWKRGHSATEIAAHFGVSRNAILGKVFRIGLTRNPGEERLRAMKLAAERRKAKAEAPAPAKQTTTVAPPSNASCPDKVWSLSAEDQRKEFALRASKGAKRALMELYSL